MYGIKIIRKINATLVSKHISRYLKKLNITRPLVITACPSTVDIVDKIKPRGIIYYCADEHSELPGMNRELVIMLERELIDKVNFILVSSKTLLKSKSKLHHNVEYLPHGVDYNHFSKSLIKAKKKPLEIQHCNNPIIGYIGLIGRHLDFSLIEYSAKRFPDYDFVFVGPIENDIGEIPHCANISYIGSKSFESLPQYLRYFDVCILPWLDIKRNYYAHPTKLREYIAAGCQVVSTFHHEIEAMKGTIYYGNTKEEFANNLHKAIEARKSFDKIKQSEHMKNETWDKRVEKINEIISKL